MNPEVQLVDTILISNFIHQVINPLNGVIGTIDNLVDGTISDPQKRLQRLRAVRGQLSHSIEMIRNLAFLSQLQSDQGIQSIREKVEKVLIPRVIIEALQYFQEIADQRGIQIELEDSETQYYVYGFEHLLKQVFINLADNCIKYGDDGSKIIITPRVQKKTGGLIVEIKGCGIGFDNDEKDKLFELGYRGQSALDSKASGSGIGLYICKRIILIAHSGEIEAEYSHKTRETIFRLRFPKYGIYDQTYRKDEDAHYDY
jgi:signal transduction histidine kinase